MMQDHSSETEGLLRQVRQGDDSALSRLLTLHGDYLRRLIDLQLDSELRARVDPSDVVQETEFAVTRRIDEFLAERQVSFRLWLRRTAMDRLIELRRKHLAQKRSVRREVSLSDASSLEMARRFLSSSPSGGLRRKELVQQIRQAIQELNERDREVLQLRHVEELTTEEVSELLSVDPDTVRKRQGRAARRLYDKLVEYGLSPNPSERD